jgi:hypothetical protein
MGDISFLILIALVAIGIGFALGSLVTGSRGDRVPAVKSKSSPVSNLVQVAGVMTDRGGKAVFLQVEGKIVRSINDLSREQRTRLLPYFEVLASWFSPPASKAAPAVSPLPSYDEVTDPGVLQPAAAGYGQAQAQRPSLNPIDVFARAIQSDVNVPQPASKSIAAQIDEILQEKIEGTEMAKRGVRLVELPNKGVVVMVGLDQYQGVDEVPDEEIRFVIKSAVAEWERRVSQ